MNFINDCESTEDLLGYLPYIEAFEYLIKNHSDLMNLPVVFGIHGKWGVGKSTFMDLIKIKLESTNEYFTIKINPWEYANELNFVSVFLSELFRVTKGWLDDDEKGQKDSINLFFKSVFKPLKISGNIGLIKAEYDFSKLTLESQKEIIDQYITENYAIKDTVHKILKSDVFVKKKIIVFIDDLDRCPSDKVMEVIESIKLIFNSENCIFFIGCDKEYLESALSIKYEKFIKYIVGEFDKDKYDNNSYKKIYERSFRNFSKEYLEKIIQVPFYIPPLNEKAINNYVDSLLNPGVQEISEKVMDLTLYDKFKTILNRKLVSKLFVAGNVNPRRMKRILNLIFLNYLFITFKCGIDFTTNTEINLLILLGVIKDEHAEFNKKYLSSEILCKRTFLGIYSFIKGVGSKNNEDDKMDGEMFTQDSDINKLFEIFFNEAKINSQKKLIEELKNISVLITINNITTSDKYEGSDWGQLGEIKSSTGTNKTLKVFLDRVKNNAKILDFVLWFFDNIYNEDKYYLGIQTNVHFYRKKGTTYDHLKNFIFKLQYEEDCLMIRLEYGKFSTIIQSTDKFKDIKSYTFANKTILINNSCSDSEIEKIRNILVEVIKDIWLGENK